MNGTGLSSLPFEIRDDLDTDQDIVGDGEVFILTIPGRAEYNGTRVQCVVRGGDGSRESEIIQISALKIQVIQYTPYIYHPVAARDSFVGDWSLTTCMEINTVSESEWVFI